MQGLENSSNCFVFADYMFHLFDYAIRLYPYKRSDNEVYGICGDKYRLMATSFAGFLKLYLGNSIELMNI